MRPWLKAGLVGGAILIALTAISLIMYFVPLDARIVLAFCASAPFLVAYPAVGVLAAHWTKPPRSVDQGAVAGLLAGLVAASIDSAFTVAAHLALAVSGVAESFAGPLTPEQIHALPTRELANALFSPRYMLAPTLLETPMCFGWAVAWAVLGGIAYAAARPGTRRVPAPEAGNVPAGPPALPS